MGAVAVITALAPLLLKAEPEVLQGLAALFHKLGKHKAPVAAMKAANAAVANTDANGVHTSGVK